jgi:hypothetical protein
VIGAVSSRGYVFTLQAASRITTMISVINISTEGFGMNHKEAKKFVTFTNTLERSFRTHMRRG